MVAVDVSTRAPAVDPASASRMSANGRAEGGEGGFGSALDSLDQGGRRAGRKGEDENAASPSPGETAGEENGAEKSRLDLSAATLARSRLPAGSSETAAQKMRTTIGADKTLADAGEQPADTAGDTLVSAKAGQVTKSLKDLAKTSKDDAGKPAEGDEKTTEAAASTDELSSMLTLLAGSGASGEAPAARLAGMSAKGGRQGEEGRSERTVATNDKANPLSALAAADSEPLVMPRGDGATDAQPDERTFRFTSARGKGASMDMIVGTARDGTASFETKAASTGGAETITVLDSRRFLGFGQSINGAALTAAMSGDPEWTSAMQPGSALSNAASQSSTGNVVNTLKLQMTPIDLGTVTATLKLVGDTLNVQLTVENRAAHKQLTQDTSGILEALRAQGFSVDQVSVNIAPAASADPSAQQGDLGQQAAGSGAGRDGSAGRDQQATQSGLPGATSGMIENDPQTDTGAHGARPDLLYV